MLFRFAKNYGPRHMGEVIDCTPEAAEPLVKQGVLVCVEPEPAAPTGPQDRAMQPPPRGRRP